MLLFYILKSIIEDKLTLHYNYYINKNNTTFPYVIPFLINRLSQCIY
jgi:hypothetical protein